MEKEMNEKGFYLTGTGGNCTAYMMQTEDSNGSYVEILITALDDCMAPKSMDEPITVGWYDELGNDIEYANFDSTDEFLKRL